MRNKHLSAAALLAVALSVCAAPATRAQVGAAPAAADENNSGDFYSCPMHPEVKSKKKGTCPKCKMDLRLTHPQPKPSDDATKAGVTGASSMNANAAAEDAHAGYARGGSSKMNIPDVELLDQNGNKVRFYSDLVKGKTVAV
ncbi:MAG TPA: heavy metal-binding domain-containing protein, partial [Pyrinomonadaceae bacterium]|nr:heavy metal-binding domain-containing protein [Pyrinomonadaceae bacterium]